MNRVSLLDGSELDLDSLLATTPRVLAVDYPSLVPDANAGAVYDAQFGTSSLPDWLSYVTDNGPASPTFDGFGAGTISLSTGSTSSGDVSVVQTDSVNWDEWSEVHVFADFVSASGQPFVTLGDNKDCEDLTEGFKAIGYDNTRTYFRVTSGGTDANNAQHDGVKHQRLGFSIEESATQSGHTVRWFGGGQLIDEWLETQGFPTASAFPISVGVRTPDGADQTATLSRMLVILVD